MGTFATSAEHRDRARRFVEPLTRSKIASVASKAKRAIRVLNS
jgi:hypothetical protein